MPDDFVNYAASLDGPAANAAVVDLTTTDATLAKTCRGLYVGGNGAVKVDMAGVGTGITFAGVVAGTVLPIRASLVYKTGTTATSIVAIY